MPLGLRHLAYPSDFNPHTSVDKIAELFINLALDLVDRTVYSIEKNTSQGKEKIKNSVNHYFSCENYRINPLIDQIIEGQSLERVLRENHLFLSVLRRKYRNLIRGARPRCWQEFVKGTDWGDDKCDSYQRCRADDVSFFEAHQIRQCENYHESWNSTSLAIRGQEDLRWRPAELLDLVYERCPALKNFTDPERLHRYLEWEYWQISESSEKRTVSGLIVRILTDFIDYCLHTMSRQLDLPPGRSLYLVRPPAPPRPN